MCSDDDVGLKCVESRLRKIVKHTTEVKHTRQILLREGGKSICFPPHIFDECRALGAETSYNVCRNKLSAMVLFVILKYPMTKKGGKMSSLSEKKYFCQNCKSFIDGPGCFPLPHF